MPPVLHILYFVYWKEKYNMASQCGPHGLHLSPALDELTKSNAAFSQLQWEIAKQDGCLPCTSQSYPSWPPKSQTSFTYPVIDSVEEVIGYKEGSFGLPFTTTEAERVRNTTENLGCFLPSHLRASTFTPSQPLSNSSQSAISIPDFDLKDTEEPVIQNPAFRITENVHYSTIPKDMMNALFGFLSDLLAVKSAFDVFNAITSPDRFNYLLLWGVFILIASLIISLLVD